MEIMGHNRKRSRLLLAVQVVMLLFFAGCLFPFLGQAATLEGNAVPISTAKDDQQSPQIVALSDHGLWFVVWEDWRNWDKTGADIYGQFVYVDDATNTTEKCGSEILLSRDTLDPAKGAPGNQTAPGAAYRDGIPYGGDDKILIVWQDTRGDDHSGFVRYLDINVTATAWPLCPNYILGSEKETTYTPVNIDKLLSRKLPKVTYDMVNDTFWVSWVESRNTLQQVSEVCFGLQNASYLFGDSSFPAYVQIDAVTLLEADAPELIRNGDTRTNRLISASGTAFEEIYKYEYFTSLNNITVANDNTSPETLFAWEGESHTGTLTCNCTDIDGDNVCGPADSITFTFSSEPNHQGLVHVYGLYEKQIPQSSTYSTRIDNSTGSTYYPTLGFDSVHRKFLAAWEDLRDGQETKVYGQLLYSGGGLYNSNFIISYSDTNGDGEIDDQVKESKQTRPNIAYDGTNQRFFVTWQDGRNSQISLENLDIYGQFVDSEGSLRGDNYPISIAGANQYSSATAYRQDRHEFLTVWKDARNYNSPPANPTYSDIYGQRFSLGQPQLSFLNLDNSALVPPLLDYGQLTAGQSAVQPIKLKNTGDTTVNIRCVKWGNNDCGDPSICGPFSLNVPSQLDDCDDGESLTLIPSGEYPLSVTFAPTVGGTFIEQFEVQSDANSPTVWLQGIGLGEPPPTAIITPSELNLTFSDTPVGETRSKNLTFSNNGNIDITVTAVDLVPSDAFTIIGLNVGTVIPKGSSIITVVKFSPEQPMTYVADIDVLYDSGAAPNHISLSGTGTAPSSGITVSTNTMDFDEVVVGETVSQNLTFTNTGDGDVSVTAVDLLGDAVFSLSGIGAGTTIKKGESRIAVVTFSPQAVKINNATLRVLYDSGAQTNEVELIGTGVATPSTVISVSPANLTFIDTGIGEKISQTLTFTNNGATAVTVQAVDLVGDDVFAIAGISAGLKIPSASSIVAVATFSPTQATSYASTLRVVYDSGVETSIVGLSGSGLATPPIITVSPASVVFADTSIGDVVSQNLAFANNGTKDVYVHGVTIAGDEGYKIAGIWPDDLESTAMKIAPGSSILTVVTFSPQAAKAYAATLIVTYFDGTSSVVGLSGTGIAIPPTISISPANVAFADIAVGRTISETLVIANNGDIPVKVVAMDLLGDGGFNIVGIGTGTSIAGGSSIVAVVTFSPQVSKTYASTLRILYDSGVATSTIGLSGTGLATPPSVSIEPVNVAFDDTVVGETISQTLTFTNNGDTAITVKAVDMLGDDVFAIAGISAGTAIERGSSIVAVVSFSPQAVRMNAATVRVVYDSGVETSTVGLSGTGILTPPTISVSPASLGFVDTAIGMKVSENLTFTNNGDTSVKVTAVDLLGDASFAISGIGANTVIGAKSSIIAVATFSPTTANTYAGTLRVLYDNGVSMTTVGLSGVGTAIPPTISVTPASVVFDDALVGQTLSQNLTFINNGDTDVTITAVDQLGDISFTVTGIAANTIINKHGSVLAVVKFSPQEAKIFAATLWVLYDSGVETSTIGISGAATSIPPEIVVTPASLEFADTALNGFITEKLTVTNNSEADVTVAVSELIGDDDFVVTGLDTGTMIPKGSSSYAFVTFTPSEPRLLAATLRLLYNSSVETTTVGLSGTGIANVSLVVSPLIIDFGKIQIGNSTTRNVTFTNDGDLDITITSINQPADPAFTISGIAANTIIPVGGTTTATITFTPVIVAAYSATLTVNYDLGLPPTEISLSGEGIDVPQVLITPASIAFADTPVGETAQANLTFTNNSEADVSITSILLTNSVPFSISGLMSGSVIKAGKTLTGVVKFMPTGVATYTDTIKVVFSGDEKTYEIPVSGSGIMKNVVNIEETNTANNTYELVIDTVTTNDGWLYILTGHVPNTRGKIYAFLPGGEQELFAKGRNLEDDWNTLYYSADPQSVKNVNLGEMDLRDQAGVLYVGSFVDASQTDFNFKECIIKMLAVIVRDFSGEWEVTDTYESKDYVSPYHLITEDKDGKISADWGPYDPDISYGDGSGYTITFTYQGYTYHYTITTLTADSYEGTWYFTEGINDSPTYETKGRKIVPEAKGSDLSPGDTVMRQGLWGK